MVIDSHQHFWTVSRGEYPWMKPSMTVLYRDYGPRELAPLLRAHGVDRTIIVQAAQTVAETEFLFEIARRTPFVAGVVGWLDLESPDFARGLDRYERDPKFVGIRPALEFIDDDRWIVRDAVVENLRTLAATGRTLDLVVYERHLPAVVTLLERIPDLSCVVDHIAKPPIREARAEPWSSLMRQVAAFPKVYCKLSGIPTEAHHDRWAADDVRPYVRHALDCFGWDRVMWGSDWPVCLLACDYGRTISLLEEVLGDELTPPRRERLFGANAARFYRVPRCDR